MAQRNTQKDIENQRVKIVYEVETEGAIEKKELPFIVGVLADLSGDRSDDHDYGKLRDRDFIEISRDNFNKVLKEQRPRVAFQVEDKLSGEKDSLLNVDITFEHMKDFEPEGIVQKVPLLNELLEIRRRLKNLHTRALNSDAVATLLDGILTQEERRQAIAHEMGRESLESEPNAEASGDGAPAPSDEKEGQ